MHRYIDELRLLQAIRLAVLATDAVGTITFVNRAATEVFATVDAELITPGASDDPLDLGAVLAGETWRGDLSLQRPRGDTFVAAVSGTPVRDPTGEITGIVVVDLEVGRATTLTHDRDASPQWSPDGSRIAFSRNTGSDDDMRPVNVMIVSVAGGEPRLISTHAVVGW